MTGQPGQQVEVLAARLARLEAIVERLVSLFEAHVGVEPEPASRLRVVTGE